MPTYSCAFVIGLGNDPTIFYDVKKAIESIPGLRVIYCTISPGNERLFIKRESELSGGNREF